jgi:hypothetical protein
MERQMSKPVRKFYFFSNEDALVFAAKVNGRREALGHYGRALVRTDLEDAEVAFLARETKRLRSELSQLLAA